VAKHFPKDEFDSVEAAGGRHRAKRTVRSRLGSFLKYVFITAVVSGLAILGLNLSSLTSQIGDLSGVGQASGQQGFNASGLGVTVIDATEQKGLASKVANSLYAAGWNVLSAVNLNLPGKSPVPVTAASPAPSPAVGSTTIVYATTPTAQSAAKDLLKTLGNYQVQLSGTYADPITVVIGSDYK